MKLLIQLLTLLIMISCQGQSETKEQISFKGKFLPVSRSSVMERDDYYTWGASPIKGDDGKYHVFYSRWKKDKGFLAWLTHSEVAHATSSSPVGPFEFQDVALTASDPNRWDGYNIHNPLIKKFGDKYYLYYTGNTGDGVATYTSFNWSHRNSQRIGVAVASSPSGPWTRFDKPIIDTSPEEDAHDALMVANPAITEMKDGRYLLIYKAVAKQRKLPGGGPVCHLYAISDSPTGPFKKYNIPIFTAEGSIFPAEDPYIWLQDGRYYAIVKDMHGCFTNMGKSLALFCSENGTDWSPADEPLVSKLEIVWEDGECTKYSHLERPQLLFEDGKPSAIFLAADQMDNYKVAGHTYNIQVKLDF